MKRNFMIVTAVLVALVLTGRAPAQDVTDAEVQRAIQRGIESLYNDQNKDGHWDTMNFEKAEGHNRSQYGGRTALAAYALLTAGESYQDPKLNKAIKFLEEIEMTGCYAIGLRSHVWGRLPDSFLPYLRTDCMRLLSGLGKGGTYNYTLTGDGDHSNTQYGVLGVWEAAKRDVPVPDAYWKRVEKHFLDFQNADGGWAYRTGDSYGSMVAAGLTLLFITQDYLHSGEYRQVGRAARHPLQERINMGLDWFGRNFRPDVNPPGRGWTYYYLYGVERVGLASGYKFFNEMDWYRAGAEFLVNKPGRGVVRRAFTLLFLVRGRVPVFINKLSIDDYDWNNRPRDVANLTRWVSDQVENEMIWQIVPLNTAPETWLDAPILYFASHKPPKFRDETMELDPSLEMVIRDRLGMNEPEEEEVEGEAAEGQPDSAQNRRAEEEEEEEEEPEPLLKNEVLKAQLKRYIDLGGMLLTSADAGNAAFTREIENLMEELYPQYRFEPVDPDDDLYGMVFKVNGRRLPLRSIHNGIRHLVVHSSRDLSLNFQMNQTRNLAPWQFMANAYYYATEKGRIRAKLEKHYEERSSSVLPKNKVVVGRGKYDGNWNPEPLAWEMQGNFMYNHNLTEVEMEPVELAEMGDANVSMVHVTGTEAPEFTDEQLAGLSSYVGNGGVVLFEAAGGKLDFADSVVAELRKAYPEKSVRPISLEHPVIEGAYDMSEVDYRIFAVFRMGRITTPRLQAILFDNEPRILISYEDMTEGMLDQPVWGVFGYSSESARKLMANIALWSSEINPIEEETEEGEEGLPVEGQAPAEAGELPAE